MRNVLFLCTGNSARSIMAQGLLAHLGAGRFAAYSAGSQSVGKVNPFALELLALNSMALAQAQSQSWLNFAQANSPAMDFVITVCDNAAGEVCPAFNGAGLRLHWSFADPAAAQGSEEEKRAAFAAIFAQIKVKIELFLSEFAHAA